MSAANATTRATRWSKIRPIIAACYHARRNVAPAGSRTRRDAGRRHDDRVDLPLGLSARYRRTRRHLRRAEEHLERHLGGPHRRRRPHTALSRQYLLSTPQHTRVRGGQSRRRGDRGTSLLAHTQSVRGAQHRRVAGVHVRAGRRLFAGQASDRQPAGCGCFRCPVRVLPVCLRPHRAHSVADDGRTAVRHVDLSLVRRATERQTRRRPGADAGDCRTRLRVLRAVRRADGERRHRLLCRDRPAVDQPRVLDRDCGGRCYGRRGDRGVLRALSGRRRDPGLQPASGRGCAVLGRLARLSRVASTRARVAARLGGGVVLVAVSRFPHARTRRGRPRGQVVRTPADPPGRDSLQADIAGWSFCTR